MAKVLVRHALVQYSSKNALGQETYETAFRGMEIDLPDGPELDKLREYGAVVDTDAQLTRPGRMMALPETAGDAEIISWVSGATNDEVEMLVRERPVMAPRIQAAWASVQERFSEQNLHLGGLDAVAAESSANATQHILVSTDNSGGTTPAPLPSTNPQPAVNDAGEADALAAVLLTPAFDAVEVVKGSPKEVADFVSDNPQHAHAILEAEGNRPQGARTTVVRAAEAAVAHGAQ